MAAQQAQCHRNLVLLGHFRPKGVAVLLEALQEAVADPLLPPGARRGLGLRGGHGAPERAVQPHRGRGQSKRGDLPASPQDVQQALHLPNSHRLTPELRPRGGPSGDAIGQPGIHCLWAGREAGRGCHGIRGMTGDGDSVQVLPFDRGGGAGKLFPTDRVARVRVAWRSEGGHRDLLRRRALQGKAGSSGEAELVVVRLDGGLRGWVRRTLAERAVLCLGAPEPRKQAVQAELPMGGGVKGHFFFRKRGSAAKMTYITGKRRGRRSTDQTKPNNKGSTSYTRAPGVYATPNPQIEDNNTRTQSETPP
eukprot:RCo016038